jgi:hypothetical protein
MPRIALVPSVTTFPALSMRDPSRCVTWYPKCSTPNTVQPSPAMRPTTAVRATTPATLTAVSAR